MRDTRYKDICDEKCNECYWLREEIRMDNKCHQVCLLGDLEAMKCVLNGHCNYIKDERYDKSR